MSSSRSKTPAARTWSKVKSFMYGSTKELDPSTIEAEMFDCEKTKSLMRILS